MNFFRFRGRVKRIAKLYQCFVENSGKGLHPTQLARFTGIPMMDVMHQLDRTHELFVKVPSADGLTRYRLTTTTSALEPEQVEALIAEKAQRETWIYYAVITAIVLVFVISIMAIAPAI